MDVGASQCLINLSRKLCIKELSGQLPSIASGIPTLLGLLCTTAVASAASRDGGMVFSIARDGR